MKPKNIVLTILSLLIVQLAFSQPMMQLKRSVADSLNDEGNSVSASYEYKKMFLKNPNDKNIVYNLACALAVSELIDSSFKYLNIYLRTDTSTMAFTDPDFINIRDDKRWNDFEDKMIVQLNIKFKNPYKDIDYAKALWKLLAYDQAYFKEIGIAGRKTGSNSSVVRSIWRYKFSINEKNLAELESLIAKKGWPKKSDVGSSAAGTAFFVIQHSNPEMQIKYLPTLKKMCEEKEAIWEHYALMYDRAQTSQKKPQRYGSQINYNEKTNSFELFPLEDESKVDEWRKEIGLGPLSDYVARWNIKFEPSKK